MPSALQPANASSRRASFEKLPAELLVQILSYVIQPKNDRIYLFASWKPPKRHPEPAPNGGSTTVNAIAETTFTYNGHEDSYPYTYDSRHKRFLLPTLTLSRTFHALTLQYMHSRLLLYTQLGHHMSADATARTRYCLRPRQEVVEGRDEHVAKLRTTSRTAKLFRRVYIALDLEYFTRTLSEELNSVLEVLVGEDVASNKARDFCIGASVKCDSYIITDLGHWRMLVHDSWYWGKRSAAALDILAVLIRWQRKVAAQGRPGVDLRGRLSLPRWYYEEEIREDGFEAALERQKLGLGNIRLEKLLDDFVAVFEGRMIMRGECEWAITGQDMKKDDREGDIVVV